MSESIYLMGSDDVRNAGNTMRSAASEMKQAASGFQSALEQHQRFLEDWLQRFEIAIQGLNKESE